MTKHLDLTQTTVSVRVTVAQAEQIERAAAACNPPKTISEYARDVLCPWAASDLGERPAPGIQATRRPRSAISEAAKLHGMTHSQYRQWVAEKAAASELAALKRQAQPHRGRTAMVPPAMPGTAQSGTYRTRSA